MKTTLRAGLEAVRDELIGLARECSARQEKQETHTVSGQKDHLCLQATGRAHRSTAQRLTELLSDTEEG